MNIRNSLLLVCLTLISGVASAVNTKVTNNTDTTFKFILEGGSHNERPFEKILGPNEVWTGQRDCTNTVKASPIARVGDRVQATWGIGLMDQVCHRHWEVVLEGNAQSGYVFRWVRFQND